MRKLKAGLRSRWVALPVLLLAFVMGVALPLVILANPGSVTLEIDAEEGGKELEVEVVGLTSLIGLTGTAKFFDGEAEFDLTVSGSTVSDASLTLDYVSPVTGNIIFTLDPLTVEVTGSLAGTFTPDGDKFEIEIEAP